MHWYSHWAEACHDDCRVPGCYDAISEGKEQLIILEDLDAAGFPKRRSSLSHTETKLCLKWLANFHALFLNRAPKGLWAEGSYWHLATRPDELAAMEEGPLKEQATTIAQVLKDCAFQTIIHGDAKLANFCFSEDMQAVAAVDFQYVGGGCGIRDVAYFLGSCLSEAACAQHEEELLSYYFEVLQTALQQQSKSVDFNALEKEWRMLYPIAWADFMRFLLGWMPTHQKINGYSLKMVEKGMSNIRELID